MNNINRSNSSNRLNGIIVINLFKSDNDQKGGKYNNDQNSRPKYLNDDVIRLLIYGKRINNLFPNVKKCCNVDPSLIESIPESERLLSQVYDHVKSINNQHELSNNLKKNNYSFIKSLNIDDINNYNIFDEQLEYHQLKKSLGPSIANSFMFKEKDIEYKILNSQNNDLINLIGGNIDDKKIVYSNPIQNPKMEQISTLLNVDVNMINPDHIRYYHDNRNSQYRPFKLNIMFDDVKEFSYLEPIKRLADNHKKDNYYKQLYDRVKNIKLDNSRLNLIDTIDPIDRDHIMLEYTKCRNKSFVITLWKPAIDGIDKLIKLLEENGNIYYVKTINLTKNGIKNLMFNMYDDFTYSERTKFITKKMEYIDTTETNNPVTFIIFDNVNDKPLSGQGSIFKRELRSKIMEYSNIDKNKYRGNDLLHINDYFYQTVEYCKMILNDNTIKMLDIQIADSLSNNDRSFGIANVKFQTLRNILYSNMSLMEQDRFITLGGTVLFAYGIRAFNDIDSVLIDTYPNRSQHLEDLMYNLFYQKKSKLFFLDGGLEDSKSWNNSWIKKDQIIMDYLKINDLNDLVLNPKYHFYFQGVKMVILEYEMIRKIVRNRTEDHVDFLMINLLNKDMIKDYVLLDEGNKEYFIINKKYEKIMGKYDDKYPELKTKILNRRYSSNQINQVKDNNIFKLFFLIKYLIK